MTKLTITKERQQQRAALSALAEMYTTDGKPDFNKIVRDFYAGELAEESANMLFGWFGMSYYALRGDLHFRGSGHRAGKRSA